MSVELEIEERNRLIGENLRKYRLLKGLTQEELASGLCSVSQLSKVENGKTHLNRTILKQMAGRLGVTVERIETTDAMLEELGEQLQLAKDAMQAKQDERALEVIAAVIDRASEFDYLDVLANAVLYKSRVLIKLHRYEEAISVIEKVLNNGEILDSTLKVLFYCELGRAYSNYGNAVMAHDAFCRADEENVHIESDEEFEVEMYFNLAKSHFMMNNNRTALRYFEKSEELATKMSKHLFRIRSTYMKATMLKRLGETKKAENIFLKALKEAEDNSFLLDIAIINNNLGSLFQSIEEYSQASAHYKRSVQVFELLNEEVYLCSPLLHLAELAHFDGDSGLSARYLEQVIELTERNSANTFREKARAYQILGWLALSADDFDQYVTNMERSLHIYDRHQVDFEAYCVAKEIADSLYEKNDRRSVEMYRKALEYNERAISVGQRR